MKKSISDIHELYEVIKADIEKGPAVRGMTRSVELVGSRFVIINKSKYGNEIAPFDEIELSEKFINRVDLTALSKRVEYLAESPPVI